MNFLPTDYEAPKAASTFYMRIQDGENKIRILSQPVLGWEEWNDKKPVRYQFKDKPAKSIDPTKPIRHFWSMIVWNYAEEQIQILHLTQASIRKTIESLSKSEEWGAPYFYDIKITRTGKDMETEYQAMPLPHRKTPEAIVDAFNKRKCNLEAVFANLDPFSEEHREYTKGIFDKDDLEYSNKIEPITSSPKVDVISTEQAESLENMISECSPDYQESVKFLLKKLGLSSIHQLPKQMFDKISAKAAEERLDFIFNGQ